MNQKATINRPLVRAVLRPRVPTPRDLGGLAPVALVVVPALAYEATAPRRPRSRRPCGHMQRPLVCPDAPGRGWPWLQRNRIRLRPRGGDRYPRPRVLPVLKWIGINFTRCTRTLSTRSGGPFLCSSCKRCARHSAKNSSSSPTSSTGSSGSASVHGRPSSRARCCAEATTCTRASAVHRQRRHGVVFGWAYQRWGRVTSPHRRALAARHRELRWLPTRPCALADALRLNASRARLPTAPVFSVLSLVQARPDKKRGGAVR